MVIYIKTVGIILREFKENNKSFLGTRNDIFKILEEFNLILIGIPINNNFKYIKNTINLCDGIIIPGGDTFTKNDFLLIDYLYQKDIPTLGICLGMQLMSLHFNNHIEKEIDNHYSTKKYYHYVKINPDSLLYQILKKDTIMVNSRHHTYIPFTKLKVNAKSDIIEGVEAPNKKFFLGVQWHPESINDTNSYQLFKYFINII